MAKVALYCLLSVGKSIGADNTVSPHNTSSHSISSDNPVGANYAARRSIGADNTVSPHNTTCHSLRAANPVRATYAARPPTTADNTVNTHYTTRQRVHF